MILIWWIMRARLPPNKDPEMLKFYFNGSPNPIKVALFLEESGLEYEAIPVDTRKGEQFHQDFVALNPNGKVPAIVDGDVSVFDSSAILLYLSEKTGQFLPSGGLKSRGDLLSWMMFVASGVGPYSGQAVHFRHFAPKGLDYAVERYLFEARRHYGILSSRLTSRPFILGDEYTIVDMAAWGWARAIPFVLGDSAWEQFPHLQRWFDSVSARPAAKRAEALKDKFEFKGGEMDEPTRRIMFPHTAQA
jgi:GSH-dependent disulfide-bond oxidoreductase